MEIYGSRGINWDLSNDAKALQKPDGVWSAVKLVEGVEEIKGKQRSPSFPCSFTRSALTIFLEMINVLALHPRFLPFLLLVPLLSFSCNDSNPLVTEITLKGRGFCISHIGSLGSLGSHENPLTYQGEFH